MNTKIWLEEVSFGFNFGNICAIWSTRVWWYFVVHIFKIKKVWIDSSNGFRDIANSLKISFSSSYVRFPVYTFQTKKPHSIILTRSWVLVYITFAHIISLFQFNTKIWRKELVTSEIFMWSGLIGSNVFFKSIPLK